MEPYITKNQDGKIECHFDGNDMLISSAPMEVIEILLNRLYDYEKVNVDSDDTNRIMCGIDDLRKRVEDLYCSQRLIQKLRDRGLSNEQAALSHIEYLLDAEERGDIASMPFIAFIDKSLRDGKPVPIREQRMNGRFAVVYRDPDVWDTPIIDICGTWFDPQQADELCHKLKSGGSK